MNEGEREFQDVLRRVIELAAEDNLTGVEELLDARVTTFQNEGVLTTNAGLVVRLDSGDEFQLTVVQSDRGR